MLNNFNKIDKKYKILMLIAIIVCVMTICIAIIEHEFTLLCVAFLLACNIGQFYCVAKLSQKLHESSDTYNTLFELYNAELKYNLTLKSKLSELQDKKKVTTEDKAKNTVKKANTKKSTTKRTTKKKKEEK